MLPCREKRLGTVAVVAALTVLLLTTYYAYSNSGRGTAESHGQSRAQAPAIPTSRRNETKAGPREKITGPTSGQHSINDTKNDQGSYHWCILPVFSPGSLLREDAEEMIFTLRRARTSVGCLDLENLDRDEALVLGHRREGKGFLTIGVTSAKRQNASYLHPTLTSLIENARDEADRSQLSIVVFACDFAERDRQEVRDVVSGFAEHVRSGLLQLVQAPRSFYPPLAQLKRTFNDPAERVYWRSKENIDVVFLMAYSLALSRYYLLLDDDFTTKPGYIRTIRDFVDQHRADPWAMLDASERGTGKLFRDEDLLRVARYLVQFYQEQPVDFLLNKLLALTRQPRRFVITPPLFKHLGYVSTLALKNKPKHA